MMMDNRKFSGFPDLWTPSSQFLTIALNRRHVQRIHKEIEVAERSSVPAIDDHFVENLQWKNENGWWNRRTGKHNDEAKNSCNFNSTFELSKWDALFRSGAMFGARVSDQQDARWRVRQLVTGAVRCACVLQWSPQSYPFGSARVWNRGRRRKNSGVAHMLHNARSRVTAQGALLVGLEEFASKTLPLDDWNTAWKRWSTG